jgi:hypothetical protein
MEMKLEIHNGEFVGTAEWQEPGKVAVEVDDPDQRSWFENYFEGEEAYLAGAVGSPEMHVERRDSSQAAFDRAVEELRRYAYTVKSGNDRRGEAYEHRAKSQ